MGYVDRITMLYTRRSFLRVLSSIALGISSVVASQDRSPRELPRPDPGTFETGDFVWPKKPGAFVPYNSGSTNTPAQDRIEWLRERDAYIARNGGSTDPLLQQRIATLRELDYREFLAVYAGAQELGVPGAYSGGSVYVGHVGIVEVDSNRTAWVIEALGTRGTIRQTYADWITARSDQVVWHGRLRQLGAEPRAKVAAEAKKYLGRPYDFWNFDLNDDAGFYCSKLAWLSIYRSLGFAVDGNNNPKRLLWFSPKQFLYLPTIDRLHDPGPYALG
jgi:hypothetical protein